MLKTTNKKRHIAKTWITGKNSTTLNVPRELALQFGLDEPTNVVMEATDEGILIRRLDI